MARVAADTNVRAPLENASHVNRNEQAGRLCHCLSAIVSPNPTLLRILPTDL